MVFSSNQSNEKRSSSWTKFRLLLWKNYILQTRHKWQTLFEIVIPILFFLLLAYMQSKIKDEDHPYEVFTSFALFGRYSWYIILNKSTLFNVCF